MWGEADLSDFEYGTVAGARQAVLSVAETAELLWFPHVYPLPPPPKIYCKTFAQPRLGFADNGKRNI